MGSIVTGEMVSLVGVRSVRPRALLSKLNDMDMANRQLIHKSSQDNFRKDFVLVG